MLKWEQENSEKFHGQIVTLKVVIYCHFDTRSCHILLSLTPKVEMIDFGFI